MVTRLVMLMFYAYKPVLLAAVCTCFRNR